MKNKPIKKNRRSGMQTVIEFSPERVKIVQVACAGSGEVKSCTVLDASSQSLDKKGMLALEKTIKKNRHACDDLTLSLDRSLVTMHVVKLPSIDRVEIEQMVMWQATKLLPYRIEEVVVSHQLLKQDQEGFSFVLIVIIPHTVLHKVNDFCHALAVRPHVITVSSEGLASWCLHTQTPAPSQEAVAILDIDDNKFEITIVSAGHFIFSRSCSLAHASDAAEKNKKIIDELRISFESYQKHILFVNVGTIFITGTQNETPDIISFCEHTLQKSVSRVNYLEASGLHKVVTVTATGAVSFTSACALALYPRISSINLMSSEMKQAVSGVTKKKQFVATIILAIVAVIIIATLFGVDAYHKAAIVKQLESELARSNPTAKELQAMKNKMNVIEAQLRDKTLCIDVLREIHAITPQSISLSMFSFDENEAVNLKGIAPSMSTVFGFVPLLNKSPFFSTIQVKYATQRKTQTGEVTDFEIICTLKHRKAK